MFASDARDAAHEPGIPLRSPTALPETLRGTLQSKDAVLVLGCFAGWEVGERGSERTEENKRVGMLDLQLSLRATARQRSTHTPSLLLYGFTALELISGQTTSL